MELYLMMADLKMAVPCLSSAYQSALEFDVPFEQHCGTSDAPEEPHWVEVAAAHDVRDSALVDAVDSRLAEALEDMAVPDTAVLGMEADASLAGEDDEEVHGVVLGGEIVC